MQEIEWLDTVKTWLNTRPERLYLISPDASAARQWLFRLVHHPHFEAAIIACVAVNTIVMMCDHWGAPDVYWTVSDALNYAFAAIFALEAVLKIIGMGYKEYFGDSWNRMDFGIVVTSATTFLIRILLQQSGANVVIDPTFVRVIKMFRAARILRLSRRATG